MPSHAVPSPSCTAVQEGEGTAWLGMHVLMVATALTLVRNNRFALVRDTAN